MAGSEKPWYTPSIVAFLQIDAPGASGIPPVHFARDVHTLEQRLAHEGESFLTKTLPALGLKIDQALQGHVPLISSAFKKRGKTALPAFLSALLRRVFTDEGWVREKPCTICIRLLRQLCFWCKKLEKGYSDESLTRAMDEFIEIDKALPSSHHDIRHVEPLLAVSRVVIGRMFRNLGTLSDFNPKHGPGAVATGESVVDKRALNMSYTQLERVFRPIPWFRSLRDASEDPGAVLDRPKKLYGLSRTAFVPKDSSGPRTIGLEPPEYMWCQQAVKAWLYDHVTHPGLARGHVNFQDQTINREFARDWQNWETLDMSKASDRNSYALVRTLFKSTVPKLWAALHACRTPGTVLPDGRTIIYKKFAPMGSAVCFPVQACVYYALAVAALHLSGMPLLLACRSVYVYGDDLIVPTGSFPKLQPAFESVGLKFNANKCCTHGKFRESCGLDCYDGVSVTPVRAHCLYPDRATDFVRIVEHSNELYRSGYWGASAALRDEACKTFPLLEKLHLKQSHRADLPILCWASEPYDETVRYKTRNGITFVHGWQIKPKEMASPLVYEARHYRESLTRVGPVGALRYCPTTSSRRTLAKRYNGVFRKSKCVVVRHA
ncbi:RNA-directed RNA polymerase [ssRNA phage SRR7976310_9]|uniref:RNA-directed RNA polymerase n=1 Tax=ssRNA phage SRR7976310_9 TaxID=2786687 RepID=A0A8S5L4W6_9VIRU|nr:RNA-directed RNA polymerase [ssRNA phage SRR7976310_9]DAD52729.1 TPA_asm: RNA-directed RNA polymerase [ssRNA phage SRR7976310_9]